MVAVAVIALGVWGCSNQTIDKNSSIDVLEPIGSPIIIGEISFPAGTTFVVESNGSITADLPDNYVIVGYNASGLPDKIEATDGDGNKITVSCSCSTSGKSCSPFSAGGNVGCSTPSSDPCQNCIMTTTKVGGAIFERPKFIDIDLGISIVTTTQELQNLTQMVPFDSNIAIVSEVVSAIEDMQSYVFFGESVPSYCLQSDTSTTIPQGYKLITINFFGYKAYYPASENFIGEATVGVLSPSTGLASCSCSQGAGCNKVEKSFGVTYCKDADKCNATCTLTL
jgi:hypothetical protein